MSGSWEIKQSKSVLVGILHTDNVTIAWALGLRNLQIPGQILPVSGMPYDHARNQICAAALQNGFEWVVMLDSDVIPPHNAIPRLLSHGKPFVSGVYHRRSNPACIPVMLRNNQWITEYPENALIEVDLVGAGLLAIHRSVLEKLPPQRPGKRWFDWRVDMAGIPEAAPYLSEDFTLCHHARNHGIPVYVDTGVIARHIGYSEYTLNKIAPLETTTNT